MSLHIECDLQQTMHTTTMPSYSYQFCTSSQAMSSKLFQFPTPTDWSCRSARLRIYKHTGAYATHVVGSEISPLTALKSCSIWCVSSVCRNECRAQLWKPNDVAVEAKRRTANVS